MLRIELCQNHHGRQRYWFRIIAANGRILASSEKYVRRIDRNKSAALVANCSKIQIIP